MWNQTFATENNSGNFSWNRKTPDTGEQNENMDTYTSELDRIYEELWNTLVKETQDKGASDSGKLKEWLAKYQQTRLRKDALDQLNQITERMEKIEERNRNRLRVNGALTYGALAAPVSCCASLLPTLFGVSVVGANTGLVAGALAPKPYGGRHLGNRAGSPNARKENRPKHRKENRPKHHYQRRGGRR